ncbi:MAG: geranylgeranyl reductase family protein [Saprospiraceae bacterium]|jgi:geranylgeranyl reductase family protein|nr:geranylgeranyl reductase family protein [Saprospiraceae bacterium]
MIQTDVCIVGAGPGGAATALKLSYLGIPSILIDKATFPRDKVCGDAISGKVTTLMSRLDPDMLKRFNENAEPIDVWGIRFVAPNLKALDIPFKPNYIKEEKSAPGYVSKRMDFDNFLIEEVKRRDNITFYESTKVTSIKRSQRGYHISTKGNNVLEVDSKLLIAANGAYSSFSRKQAGLEKDPKHYAAAVRAYYKNVKGLSADNFIELHFIKAITPGYFWIFPLPNGEANVGLGMRSDILAKRKVNLKKSFKEVVEEHPMFKERFKDAEVLTKLEGYGLPLGSKRRVISGDHFMLVGDAGHLVDPLTGEGIGNAFYSGFIAAEQVQKCLEVENYSAEFLTAYDVRVSRVLGSEMRLSYRLQRMLMYPWIVNLIANIIASNKKIINVISGMYNDFDLREQLVKPIFWVKMWFK